MVHRVGRFTLVAVLALLAAACGGGAKETGFPSPGETRPTASPTSTATRTGGGSRGSRVEVVDNNFEPRQLTVAAGTEVTWFQTGTQPHDVTADDGSFESHPDCSVGDPTKCMRPGGEFKRRFTEAGSFPYYCTVHGFRGGSGMAGTITVT